MGYQHWKYETLHAFCMEAFEKFGFTEAEANIIQDVLLTSDLMASRVTECSVWYVITSASKRV